jgi:hypothetical protein
MTPQIILYVIMECIEEKYIILKVSRDNIDLTDLIAKQAESNFDIIRSIWYIQDKVSSIIIIIIIIYFVHQIHTRQIPMGY